MTALPSEVIEPIVEGAIALCIQELVSSDGDDAACKTFLDQLCGIDRMIICASDINHGMHASLVVMNFIGRAQQLIDLPHTERLMFIERMRAGQA